MNGSKESFEKTLLGLDKSASSHTLVNGVVIPTPNRAISFHNAELLRYFAHEYMGIPTCQSYNTIVRKVMKLKSIAYLLGKDLDSLSQNDLKELNIKLKERFPKSASEYRAALKKFFKMLDKEKYKPLIESDFLVTNTINEGVSVDANTFWDQEQCDAYLYESKRHSIRQQAFAALWLTTALRPQEHRAITKSMITRKDNYLKISIPRIKTKERTVVLLNGEATTVWKNIQPYLENLNENERLFPLTWAGLNKINNIPIILDPFSFANYNGLILGTSGGGKSVTAKLFILRNILRGVKTIMIDPQGEYVDLTKTYNGQLVEIKRDSESIINPFDLMGADLGEKTISLMDLFKILCGELTEVQKNILDKAVHVIYQEKGILPDDASTWTKEPPIMEDLYNEIIKEKKTASRLEKMTYEALENRLRIYVKGSFSFINKQTNLDLTNDLICFNIANMPSQIKPVMMYLILDFVHKKMQKDRERKTLIIDEAWSLLRFAEHSKSIFELIKTARKFGLGIVIITQEVEDLLTSPAGKTILANTAWKYLSRQEPACIVELAEKFHLNQEEQNYLLTAMPGEGLLFAMNDHIPLRVIPSPSEYELITTNPDEVRKREQKLKELATIEKENLEPYKLEKNYYPTSELNEQQTSFLKNRGFVEARLCGLDAQPRLYLVKQPNTNESIEHYFLAETIAEEIRHYTKNAKTNLTTEADIVFEVKKDGQTHLFAFEIETGTQLKNSTTLSHKIELNNSKYSQWWFIVTQKDDKEAYNTIHPTLRRTEIKPLLENLFKEESKNEQ